jgi:hypothetical protein
MTRGSNSDDAGRAPSTMRALKSGTHDLGITCAIKTIVNSPFGHDSSNVFLDRSLNSSWVEAIRRTKLLGVIKLVRIEVDGNDFGGSGHLGTLDHGESLRIQKQLSICVNIGFDCVTHVSKQNITTIGIKLRTTAPKPNTATVLSTSTLQVFQTAPNPVLIPQPNRHIFSNGAFLSILAHEISAKTVYSDMVEQPMK